MPVSSNMNKKLSVFKIANDEILKKNKNKKNNQLRKV
jgi:hypothetical protein